MDAKATHDQPSHVYRAPSVFAGRVDCFSRATERRTAVIFTVLLEMNHIQLTKPKNTSGGSAMRIDLHDAKPSPSAPHLGRGLIGMHSR